MRERNFLERFWNKVKVGRPDECWLWTAAKTGKGYSQFWTGRLVEYGHVISYEFVKGPVPQGLELDHLCRTPACVNPAHLEAVTHRENMARGENPAALEMRQTHCKRGHLLPVIRQKDGRRRCPQCKSRHARVWYLKKKAKGAQHGN